MINWIMYLLIVILIQSTCPLVTAEIYKWVDENGVLHFSDSPPENVESEHTVDRPFSVPLPANSETENAVKKPTHQMNPKPNSMDRQDAVEIESKEELDLNLRSIWAITRENLKNSNIDGALQYFFPTERERYKRIFLSIDEKVPGGISAAAEKLPDPILIEIEKDKATYILVREENGNLIEYNLVFIKDPFSMGQWMIYEY